MWFCAALKRRMKERDRKREKKKNCTWVKIKSNDVVCLSARDGKGTIKCILNVTNRKEKIYARTRNSHRNAILLRYVREINVILRQIFVVFLRMSVRDLKSMEFMRNYWNVNEDAEVLEENTSSRANINFSSSHFVIKFCDKIISLPFRMNSTFISLISLEN
jgi:hypothetical protein